MSDDDDSSGNDGPKWAVNRPGSLSSAGEKAARRMMETHGGAMAEAIKSFEAIPIANLVESYAKDFTGIPVPHVSHTNPARWTYQRLKNYIRDFEKDLDNTHEVAAKLVSFGQAVVIHITDLGYWGPDIITFSGADDAGQDMMLIQHTSQLSVLLIAVKVKGDKPRRIGFLPDSEETEAPPTSPAP